MNREIKFRAWNKKTQEIIHFPCASVCHEYSCLTWSPDEDDGYAGIANLPDAYDGDWDMIEETNYTLMQYTGLKDKNGVEIYEGDVISREEEVASDSKEPTEGYIHVRKEENFVYSGGKVGTRYFGQPIKTVKWEESSCGFEPFSDSNQNCMCCGGGECSSNWEVIGNIYENPELLNHA